MPIYEYLCENGHHFETWNSVGERKTATCTCGATAHKVLTAPTFHLDPVSGDFPSATRKWAMDKQKANYEDLQELGLRKSRKTYFTD